MRLATLPPHGPFLETVAARWLGSGRDPADGLILLPTRRAARALADAFLRVANGRPMLLPRIAALGAVDEAPLALSGALSLPPALPDAERLASLTRLVLALPPERGGPSSLDAAWRLAQSLAELMDEAARADVDLADALPTAADPAYAEHWQVTLQFLHIAMRVWPEALAAQGAMDPAARQVALLRAQARAWEDTPPECPVWVAGTTGAIPAVAALLRVVARLPAGQVILPGLDLDLPDSAWDTLAPTHPQAALRALLAGIGALRGDVARWEPEFSAAPARRTALLNRALLPAAALPLWRDAPIPAEPGLFRLSCADQAEEAAAIAMILRDALEQPGQTAALVTPDRALARRVTAELRRWGIVADDSAGEALSETPPSVFLRLLAAAVAAKLAPVALLALLKHPLAAAGLAPAACREAARALELAALRGPAPQDGMLGLRQALGTGASADVNGLLSRLETCLEPLLRVAASPRAAPAHALAALVGAGEALAASDTEPGADRLWRQEEGAALAATLSEALDALAAVPDSDRVVDALPGLLDALLEGTVVRSRRALRGLDGVAEHPRVFVWGLLEARLQTADVIVLGGLAEGRWPPLCDPGPWLSRPMRRAAGLPSPEERIGLAAHDFVMSACAAPVAVLSCPRRADGAPAVPSRWLVRLEALLAGQGATLPEHPAAAWVRQLDRPAGPPQPAEPPRPRPPARLRPTRLSVTEIESLIADPYAIYARHVLRLKPLDAIEQDADALDYGTIVHRGLERFLRDVGEAWPPDAPTRLNQALQTALLEGRPREALREWWSPRLARIAGWVAETEAARRATAPPAAIGAELRGEWQVPGTSPPFTLSGRADRIERAGTGGLRILDYKTGTPPTQNAVDDGSKPQLLLEAAMAKAGAFGAAWQGDAAELIYWKLGGGWEPGKAMSLFDGDADATRQAAELAAGRLRTLLLRFADADTPYLSRPHPARSTAGHDYDQLARAGEWAVQDGGGP